MGLAAFVDIIFLPILLKFLCRPEKINSSVVEQHATNELQKMGNPSISEKILMVLFPLLLIMWATHNQHCISTTAIAFIGIIVLFWTFRLKAKEFTQNHKVWNQFLFMGGFLTMIHGLEREGVLDEFATGMKSVLSGLNGVSAGIVIAVVYAFTMYGFSMVDAHAAAMIGSFLKISADADVPPKLMLALLAPFQTLCAATTNYSSGSVLIYYGLGHVTMKKWLAIGFIILLLHFAIWFSIGMAWWKILGHY